jgi:hypothetical protein
MPLNALNKGSCRWVDNKSQFPAADKLNKPLVMLLVSTSNAISLEE